MTNDEKEAARGRYAQEVLDNCIYKEAYVMLRAKLFEDFSKTKFRDSEERDEIWRKLQVVDYIENYMIKVMQSGKIAEETLLQKTKKVLKYAR
jgi:hypothetical protein